MKMAKNITNKQQMAKLVELMQKNPDFARGINTINHRERWESFAFELNNLGPPFKTYDRWSKVWVDLKSKTKKKLKNQLMESRNPNKRENIYYLLTPIEHDVDELLEISKNLEQMEEPQHIIVTELSANPFTEIKQEIDITPADDDDDEHSQSESNIKEDYDITEPLSYSSYDDVQPSNSIPSSPPPEKRRRAISEKNSKLYKINLLEKHSKSEQKFHKLVVRKLEGIEHAMNMMRKEQKEHHQKILDMAIEKIRLKRENNANKEKYRAEKMKILKNMKAK